MVKERDHPAHAGSEFGLHEYSELVERLGTVKVFEKKLTLEVANREFQSVLRLFRQYVQIFTDRGIRLNIIEMKHGLGPKGLNVASITIAPIKPLVVEKKVVNNHYFLVREELREGKRHIIIEFFMNKQYNEEIGAMDHIVSLLATLFEKNGFKVVQEQLERFEPHHPRK